MESRQINRQRMCQIKENLQAESQGIGRYQLQGRLRHSQRQSQERD